MKFTKTNSQKNKENDTRIDLDLENRNSHKNHKNQTFEIQKSKNGKI